MTGLMAGWLAFSVSGGALLVERYVLHQASQIDAEWKTRVETSQQMTRQWTSGIDPPIRRRRRRRRPIENWMLSPWGHAGIELFGFATNSILLLFFATGGGAMGARFLGRAAAGRSLGFLASWSAIGVLSSACVVRNRTSTSS